MTRLRRNNPKAVPSENAPLPASFKYIGAFAGATAAIALIIFPAHQDYIEVVLLTTTVLVLVGYGLWEFRAEQKFFTATYVAIALHGVFLIALWQFLPLDPLFILALGVLESFLIGFVVTPFLESEVPLYQNLKNVLKRNK